MKIAGHPLSEVAPEVEEIRIIMHDDDDDRCLLHLDGRVDGDHVCKHVEFMSRHELAETLYPILKEMGIR